MKNKIFTKPKSSDVKVVKIKTDTKFFGTLKLLLVIGVIALQIFGLIALYFWLTEVFVGYLGLSFLLSFCTCFYVVSSNKNGYSKAVWTIFLLVFFEFAWFFYLISDETIFFKKSKKYYKKIFNDYKFIPNIKIKNTDNRINLDATYLSSTANFPVYSNCKCDYYNSGTKLFDEILKNIKKAKKFVFIEYFIIADGVLLTRLLDILKQKVQEGVDVRIIYDDMGCHSKLKHKTKKYIKKIGIKLECFNRLVPIFNIALNYRDHRKIVIIDGNFAFTGGANLSDEYINEKRMHGYWKDSGIKVQGKAVDSFTIIFLRQWAFVTKKLQNLDKFLNMYKSYKNDSLVIPYADGLDYKNNIGMNLFNQTITQAQEKIYIMTPYFVPEETILTALKNKALAGADVRILLPQIPDKSYVYKVSINNAKKLTKFGIKVYLLKNSFVHSKCLLTDYQAIVGTINMDLRSFYQQFENAVYTNDKKIMNDILTDFNDCFFKSKILNYKKDNLINRIIVGILRIFSPLM